MSIGVAKHRFVSNKADSGDATLIQPSNWNDYIALAGGVNGQFPAYDSTNANYKSKWAWLPGDFNILDYGAVGGNSGDDGPSIQAAIDAAGNGRVIFPPDIYRVATPLVVSNRFCQLDGTSMFARINWVGGSGAALTINTSDCRVHRLRFTGTDVAGEIGINVPATAGVSNVFEQLYMANFRNAFRTLMFDMQLLGLHVDMSGTNGQIGLYLGSNANAILVQGCEITGTAGATNNCVGIVCTDNAKVRIVHNQIQFCEGGNVVIDDRDGIRTQAAYIGHNYMESTKAGGLDIILGNNVEDTTIEGNYHNANSIANYCVQLASGTTFTKIIGNMYNDHVLSAINNNGSAGASTELYGNDVHAGSLLDSLTGVVAFLGAQPTEANYRLVMDLMLASATSKLGFYGKAPIAQQADGAALTNSVTSGGTTNTIANYTDLSTYATDAAAIRNNLYQLARKLKIVDDALRAYGLLT